MDRQPPTAAQGAADPKTRAPKSPSRHIYALQVQGFIEAAEVVDVDSEVMEDLLQDFARTASLDSDSDDEDVNVEDLIQKGAAAEEAAAWEALFAEGKLL